MKKFKKWLLVVLMALSTLCLAVGLAACNKGNKVQPVAGTPELEYTLSKDGTYYIASGLGTCPATEIVIGNTYNDLPVKEIGEKAFSGCTKLTSITISNGIQTIGAYAFGSWSGFDPETGDEISLDGCIGLTNITIPNSVTVIGEGAFADCSGLKSVTIGNGVIGIGRSAFAGCGSLKSVKIGKGVQEIGSGAFQNCSSLTSITIPSSVTKIWDRAFYGCDKLIQTENGVQYVDKWVVGCDTNVTSVTLRSKTVGIGNYAFLSCSGLTSITIPSSVKEIGIGAFYNCSGLKSITIPNSVKEIGDSAFEGCSSLTSVTIGNGVTSIGGAAFYNCSSLTNITIPSGVTSIGGRAFLRCSSLTSVTFENTVGWSIPQQYNVPNGFDIESEDLADPDIAAAYLTSLYGDYSWQRD